MAESSLESFLKCSVCLDILTEPVSLSCHHSFCRLCLRKHWDQRPSRPCPLCRRTSSKENLDVNFALKELSISFRQKLQLSGPTPDHPTQDCPTPGETTAPLQRDTEEPTAQTQQKQWSVCPSHPQVPPLFCLDDSRPLCPLCEFSLHPQHTVVSGEEAERRLKELISSQLQTLKKEKHHCEELQQTYEDIQGYTEKQAAHCEHHIRAVFSRLHKFLQEEEQRALSALREEQLRQKQTMGPELEKLKEKLSSVDEIIQDLEQQLETHSYRPRQEATPPQGTSSQSTPPHQELKEGLLLDQAKVLGNLGFRVWTRMKREVKYQPVILDPNTASPSLCLTEDLSSVSFTETLNKDLPFVLERFCHYAIVLGSVGYSSGSHQWDVEVGDHHDWTLGVAKESIERKQKCPATPEQGLFCFEYFEKRYNKGYKHLKVKKSPEKIRVKLDFNKGTLTFSDADHMTPLCVHTVHKGTSPEKLFPFFCVGPAGGAKTTELRICEVKSEDSNSMQLSDLF